MTKVSVNLSQPSPYIENGSYFYRLKRRLTYSFAFRLLNKYLLASKDLNLLEIGTGSGFFLDFCRREFKGASLYGLEYDERLLEVTRARVPTAICNQGNAENFEFEHPEFFDVIASFQVIEHLYDPKSMLMLVHRYLKKDGLFIVTSPNLDGYGAKLLGSRWHGYREDHVSLKGVRDWNELISTCGFKCLYSGSTFFSGIPWANRLPFGVLNWLLLVIFGSLKWNRGESYVGVFRRL
jgi:2-polyprenyl-3-methyl-5-hydroxy-6-metoxy-1,4-benzoquinol methylase